MRIQSVQLVCSAATAADLPGGAEPEVAVSGRSNVGKSSLLNSLFRRKDLARVSRTPGKTQLLHFYRVDERFHLVDLPGYGHAAVPQAVLRRWRGTMQAYLQERRQLVGVIQLLDCRHEPSAQDREMIAWLLEARLHFCLVPTKIDKLGRGERRGALLRLLAALELPGDLPLVPYSSRTGEGREELLGWLGMALSLPPAGLSAPPVGMGPVDASLQRGTPGHAGAMDGSAASFPGPPRRRGRH
ncbi:MAG TPA: ribosome biogenesis GTP-binding protein YihA/YsxC [Candidatus Krumholzibacteria bacterium]|nr:ribosome biogenesis GTP-binding protein YihA/YsxC [Candidatus Krumholzibacteria bacterium]